MLKLVFETLEIKLQKIEIGNYSIKSDKEFWDLLLECKEIAVVRLVNLVVNDIPEGSEVEDTVGGIWVLY